MIRRINFNEEPLGPYTEERIRKVWNVPKKVETYAKPTIVKDGKRKVLQLSFPKGSFGQEHKVNWHMKFNKSYETLSCQYKIKFEKGFDFRRGGKLPGFAGGDKPAGGDHSDKGFTARIMWREKGDMHQYVYYPKDGKTWGTDFWWHDLCSKKMDQLKFKPGEWHTIKMKIKMNKFKKERNGKIGSWRGNGHIICWLDGKLALHQDIQLRTRDCFKDKGKYKYGIDWFLFTVFFGGGDKTWAPRKDCKMYFDEFIFSTEDIE